MTCGDYQEYYQYLFNWQFFDSIWCLFAGEVGLLLAPLMVFGPLAVASYIYAESAVLPLVFVLILGGVIVVQLPAGVVRFVGIVVLLTVAGGGYLLTQQLES